MARIRTVKPEFWASEQVMDCSPLARLLFIGVLNFSDDGGNQPASAKSLRAKVFPSDEGVSAAEVEKLLVELVTNGLLAPYEHQGKEYIHVTGWHHQRIDKPTIKYPKYEAARAEMTPCASGTMQTVAVVEVEPSYKTPRMLADYSSNDRLLLAPVMERNGKESKKEQETPASCAAAAVSTAGRSEALEGFDEFWQRYPKKKSKRDAEKAWTKLKPNAALRATLMAALNLQAKSEDWCKQNGQYVPNPVTWLSGRRWEDEVQVAPLGNHHGMNGERDYTFGLEANDDGTFRF